MVVRRPYTYFNLPGFMNVAANTLAVVTFLITAENQVCSLGSYSCGFLTPIEWVLALAVVCWVVGWSLSAACRRQHLCLGALMKA